MQKKQISPDDLEDVKELTSKLEESMMALLVDNDIDLAFSALMSATINCMLTQCDSIKDAEYYRDVFIKIINVSLASITKKCGN